MSTPTCRLFPSLGRACLLVAAWVIGFGAFGGLHQLQAASQGLSITPPQQELSLDKNQPEALLTVSLTNNSEVNMRINLAVLDFGALGESGGVILAGSDSKDLPEKYRLATWLRLSDSQVDIPAKSTKPITLTVVNTADLTPGGHYGALVATLVSLPSADKPVTLNQSLSSLLFVNKQGGENYRLELKDAQVQRSWWGGVKGSQLKFSNAGNVHLVPRGTVVLQDPTGRQLAKGVINQESGFILPESSRIYHPDLLQMARPLWPGTYTMIASYRYEGSDTAEKQEFTFFHPGLVLPSLVPILLLLCGVFLLRRKLLGKASR